MTDIEIKKTKYKGRGVFATRNFSVGEIIEICPIIELPEEDTERIDKTKLYSYYFNWGKNLNRVAIALGYGALYNHSYEPNAVYEKDFKKNILTFKCLKPIKQGKEITVTYRGNPYDKTPVWFEIKQ